jgi:hypothetical protein
MRWRTSRPMSRPSSAWPKSNTTSRADFSKNTVRVKRSMPGASGAYSNGRS